jgi:hypothetical protein
LRQVGTQTHPELTFAFVVLFPGELSKQLPAPDLKKKKKKYTLLFAVFLSNDFNVGGNPCLRRKEGRSNSHSLRDQASKQWRKKKGDKDERSETNFHAVTMNVLALLNFY